MENTTKRLNEIKQFGYELDFGQALEQAFLNYKKIALLAGAVILLLVIVFYALLFGVMGVFLSVGSLTDYFTPAQAVGATGPTLTTLLFSALAGLIGAVLIAPLSAGLLQMAHNSATFKDFSFATAFEHYKSKFIKDLILAAVIIALTTNVISLVLEISFPLVLEDGTINGANIFAKIISFILSVLIAYVTLFTFPLIIFGELTASQAIIGSLIIISKRPFVILFLMLVALVGAMIGVIGCFIGIFFTLPLLYSTQYVIYRTAIGIEEENELDEIGQISDFH